MTSDEFIPWLEGFATGADDNMKWEQAWSLISAKLNTFSHKVSHGSDVVDTDNNWCVPSKPPGAR